MTTPTKYFGEPGNFRRPELEDGTYIQVRLSVAIFLRLALHSRMPSLWVSSSVTPIAFITKHISKGPPTIMLLDYVLDLKRSSQPEWLIVQFIWAGIRASFILIRTLQMVLTSTNKNETAVHGYGPWCLTKSTFYAISALLLCLLVQQALLNRKKSEMRAPEARHEWKRKSYYLILYWSCQIHMSPPMFSGVR